MIVKLRKDWQRFLMFIKKDFIKNMLALALTFRKEREAQIKCFMRNYAERFDWLVQVFQD